MDSEQLYDLMFDPVERSNLARDPNASEVLEDLRGRLDKWMLTTDDPLLRGPVPLPQGTSTTDTDGYSP